MIPTGLLGGSFNPAHRAHRRISLFALHALGLREMWWLVSPGNPLKDDADDMAAFGTRFRSAARVARGAPIRVTAIEARLGTRYTADTLAKLVRAYPRRRFLWLMGADNLAQFHHWREWRRIARTVTIAVIARPGYDGGARHAKAMGWLRRFVRPQSQSRCWTQWRPPALVLLHFRPDPTSATRLRAALPDWDRLLPTKAPHDRITRRPLPHGG